MIFYGVLDNSIFSEVQKNLEGGFKLFNQFAVFVYSQLQSILPDTALGSISDWSGFLQLNLSQTTLPFKAADDYVLNEDYHRVVVASKLPRLSKIVDQSIPVGKALCKELLDHGIVKSSLIRGLCASDPGIDSRRARGTVHHCYRAIV